MGSEYNEENMAGQHRGLHSSYVVPLSVHVISRYQRRSSVFLLVSTYIQNQVSF